MTIRFNLEKKKWEIADGGGVFAVARNKSALTRHWPAAKVID